MTLRSRLSSHFRKQRAETLRKLIDELARARNKLNILDLGGRIQYWDQVGRSFLRERNVTITILNLHSSEIIREDIDGIFSFEVGDACDLNYKDLHFDLAHSNSVIEHVGDWQRMQSFAQETRRVAKNHYIQTPYLWFPIDPHFYAFPMFHWLPRAIRALLLMAFPLAASGRASSYHKALQAVDSSSLLDLRQFRLLFPDSRICTEKFAGFPKSLIAIR
jgi:hypothetical protein